ncbi:hypothetical protein Tco_0263009 [Tanacetum coccineum]
MFHVKLSRIKKGIGSKVNLLLRKGSRVNLLLPLAGFDTLFETSQEDVGPLLLLVHLGHLFRTPGLQVLSKTSVDCIAS